MEEDYQKIFDFLACSYGGNWVYRWELVPFVNQVSNSKQGESVLAHQQSCIMLWSLLKSVMPELSSLVNTELVYDLLMFHDLGEIASEDTPLVKQLREGSSLKKEMERLEIEKNTMGLPQAARELINKSFFDYSYADENEATVEVLLARYVNSMQGNHFAMVYGFDFIKHADLIMEIVNKYFTPVANELISKLATQNNAAANEVKSLTNYHLATIKEIL